MISPDTLFLYSTNCWLSFVIGEEYYDSVHYVWTSPIFDTGMIARRKSATPRSSTRKKSTSICLRMHRGETGTAQ